MKHDYPLCPACGNDLVPAIEDGATLRCKHCGWHLITLAAWKLLSPFDQGYTLYMQSNWETSELAQEKNPYVNGTAEWDEFRHGEYRAMLSAQDGEE
jgi:hypothetical protein